RPVKRVLAACGWCLAAGCLTERPRPAPPTLALSLNKTTVRSRTTPAPDTLVVTVRAEDADGIDSVWVQLDDQEPLGADGLFDPVLEGPFRLVVPAGFDQAEGRSEEHTSELQSRFDLVCRLLLEKKKTTTQTTRRSVRSPH